MAEIKCPMCSKPNPEDLDVCQFCEARLKPLTGELDRSQPPIHPGDAPIEKNTGELEPVLPQWLREVRQQARESVEEEPEQASVEEEAVKPDGPADLLAGLQSQAEDDEEIPDWLSGLRGESAQAVTEGETTEENDLAALKSMPGEETPESGESEASELPGWISDLGTRQSEENELSEPATGYAVEEEIVQAGTRTAASESDFEWGAEFETDSAVQSEFAEDTSLFDSELPDWLKGADDKTKVESDSGLPDWMKAEEPDQATPSLESEEGAEPVLQQEDIQPAAEGDIPDWLASLDKETSEIALEEKAQPAPEGETSDWFASLGEETAEAAPQEAAQPATEGDMPDWLSSLGDGGADVAPLQEVEQPVTEQETPDWLAAMGEGALEFEDDSDELVFPSLAAEEPAHEKEPPSANIDAAGAPLPAEDVEALFSMDMPEWLTDAGNREIEEKAQAVPAEENLDDLRPAELPGWVQAMRPVEAVFSEVEGGAIADQPVEEKGPLAGLRGVLPAVPGVGPTSKPKAYSIKLQASEEQQSNAAKLEQLLAAETQPKPITTQPVVISQRFLRWIIAIVLLLAVGGSVLTGTQINPLPTGFPPETFAVLNYVQGNLPADAPVLLIFDYDAALAGELEVAAAPLVDQMLTLKHPRLSLISSTPLGAGLAESFMKILLTDREYGRGEKFINLGYLPGGAAGVLAFADNPATTIPTTIDGESAWETPVLQGVKQLSDFSAILLLTNDAETARVWIEQTEHLRKETRFFVISSAQTGPMILPYVQSGQVDGMVTGLDGGAPIERVNNGRPGMARHYWDAYGMGLLAALVMILLGSLLSLLTGWRERNREQGEI